MVKQKCKKCNIKNLNIFEGTSIYIVYAEIRSNQYNRKLLIYKA
jgi:hypothetical protein